MKISSGEKIKKFDKIPKKSIIDIDFENNYKLYVFPGKLSKNDIKIMYSENGKRIRTPRHIHWVVDLLLKMQKKEDLTKAFINELKEEWKKSSPLKHNDEPTLVTLVNDCVILSNASEYKSLDKYGEYNTEFLIVLMNLLMTQEKTNNPNAFMFGKILDSLLDDDLDIFSIMSTAGFGGRKG